MGTEENILFMSVMNVFDVGGGITEHSTAILIFGRPSDRQYDTCLFDDEAYEGQGILLYVSKMATTMHCTKTTFLEFFHSVTKETKFCNKA